MRARLSFRSHNLLLRLNRSKLKTSLESVKTVRTNLIALIDKTLHHLSNLITFFNPHPGTILIGLLEGEMAGEGQSLATSMAPYSADYFSNFHSRRGTPISLTE